ncbi:hypothetical protein E2320_015813 [Naja naja]|nr:hypothetical protein E2320_015813 [Naja naja]
MALCSLDDTWDVLVVASLESLSQKRSAFQKDNKLGEKLCVLKMLFCLWINSTYPEKLPTKRLKETNSKTTEEGDTQISVMKANNKGIKDI